MSHKHLLVAEQFDKIGLIEGQPLEDFHNKLMEKGKIIQKTDFDVCQKFISCLPDKLEFFVRVRNPSTALDALQAAKMGDGYGYRVHSACTDSPDTSKFVPVFSARAGNTNTSSLELLESRVDKLTDIITMFMMSQT